MTQPTTLKVDVKMMELLQKAMAARSDAKVSTSGFRILATKKRKREQFEKTTRDFNSNLNQAPKQ